MLFLIELKGKRKKEVIGVFTVNSQVWSVIIYGQEYKILVGVSVDAVLLLYLGEEVPIDVFVEDMHEYVASLTQQREKDMMEKCIKGLNENGLEFPRHATDDVFLILSTETMD